MLRIVDRGVKEGLPTAGQHSRRVVCSNARLVLDILQHTPTEGHAMASRPPDNLPVYRLLTGKDDAAFCQRVSEALRLGYELYGSPAMTFNGEHAVVAQAVLWKDAP
jgi:hypothetical protein